MAKQKDDPAPPRERKAPRELPVLPEQLVHKVQPAHKVLKEKLARKVHKEK